MLYFIIFFAIFILLLWLYFKFFKIPKIKNIVFIDGSLGTGKTYYSVALGIRLYKKQLLQYKFKKFVFSFISKKKLESLEEPVLYSNIKLRNIKFTLVTKDLLFRQNYRFAYKSVLILDEFSLVADQMLYKNAEINERLSEFFKLFRHETRGGYIIVNSQSISDLHYSLKYVLSDYFYIQSKIRIPFFSLLNIIESTYNADKSSSLSTSINSDVDENVKKVIVSKKYFKYYDTYCYSIFTDSLPIYKTDSLLNRNDGLKASNLVSFKDFKYLYENMNKPKVCDCDEKQEDYKDENEKA